MTLEQLVKLMQGTQVMVAVVFGLVVLSTIYLALCLREVEKKINVILDHYISTGIMRPEEWKERMAEVTARGSEKQ